MPRGGRVPRERGVAPPSLRAPPASAHRHRRPRCARRGGDRRPVPRPAGWKGRDRWRPRTRPPAEPWSGGPRFRHREENLALRICSWAHPPTRHARGAPRSQIGPDSIGAHGTHRTTYARAALLPRVTHPSRKSGWAMSMSARARASTERPLSFATPNSVTTQSTSQRPAVAAVPALRPARSARARRHARVAVMATIERPPGDVAAPRMKSTEPPVRDLAPADHLGTHLPQQVDLDGGIDRHELLELGDHGRLVAREARQLEHDVGTIRVRRRAPACRGPCRRRAAHDRSPWRHP